MPRGPHGEKRPADLIGNAVMVAKIATGEIAVTTEAPHGREGRRGRDPVSAMSTLESGQ
jgi:hypothetical protein